MEGTKKDSIILLKKKNEHSIFYNNSSISHKIHTV